MQKFSEYEALVSDQNEDLYGESIRVEPRADGEFVKGIADAARPVKTIIAIVDFEPKVLKTRYGGRNDADSSDVIGEKLHISIREGLLSYELRPGDLIHLLDRLPPYPSTAAVSTIEPDGIGRLLVRCKPGRPR